MIHADQPTSIKAISPLERSRKSQRRRHTFQAGAYLARGAPFIIPRSDRTPRSAIDFAPSLPGPPANRTDKSKGKSAAAIIGETRFASGNRISREARLAIDDSLASQRDFPRISRFRDAIGTRSADNISETTLRRFRATTIDRARVRAKRKSRRRVAPLRGGSRLGSFLTIVRLFPRNAGATTPNATLLSSTCPDDAFAGSSRDAIGDMIPHRKIICPFCSPLWLAVRSERSPMLKISLPKIYISREEFQE